MQSHSCQTCQAQVLVAKYSPVHTSVQWNAEASAICPAKAAAAGINGGYMLRCESLDASIDSAVTGGQIDHSLRAEPKVVPIHQPEAASGLAH